MPPCGNSRLAAYNAWLYGRLLRDLLELAFLRGRQTFRFVFHPSHFLTFFGAVANCSAFGAGRDLFGIRLALTTSKHFGNYDFVNNGI